MRSRRPKVLPTLCGRPMVAFVLEAVRGAGVERCVAVIGRGAGEVRAALGDGLAYAEQPRPLGTGDAVARARTWRCGRSTGAGPAAGAAPSAPRRAGRCVWWRWPIWKGPRTAPPR